MISGPVLVTGGSGFLGSRIVDELQIRYPEAPIRILDLVPPKDRHRGVEFVQGDIADRGTCDQACVGVETVIHCASLIDWGAAARKRLQRTNVRGTRNMLDAATAVGVRAFIYTSSLDVVLDWGPIVDGDESLPYPAQHRDHYSRSKTAAEQMTIAADCATMRTCSIRPCGMFGEDDPYHIGRFLQALRAGQLKMRVGDGSTRFEHVYVGNVAWTHAAAVADLLGDATALAGNCYFVTDRPAENFLDFFAPLAVELGFTLPPPNRYLPTGIARALGAAVEFLTWPISRVSGWTPSLTRASVAAITTDTTFKTDRIWSDLGQGPKYDPELSMRQTIDWYKQREPA